MVVVRLVEQRLARLNPEPLRIPPDLRVTPYLAGHELQGAIGHLDGRQGGFYAMWPNVAGGSEYVTGHCRGNAGNLAFLINFAEHFPGW